MKIKQRFVKNIFRKKKQADKQKAWIIKVYDFRHFRCQFYLLSPYRNKIWLDIIRSTKYWCIHQILFSRPISEYCSPHKSLFTWIMLRGLNPKGCESCFLSKMFQGWFPFISMKIIIHIRKRYIHAKKTSFFFFMWREILINLLMNWNPQVSR